MKFWLQKLTDISALAYTKEMFDEALAGLVREMGFDCYAYLNFQAAGTFAVSNYPPEWQDRYFASRLNEIDPVVATAKSKMLAFIWSAEDSKQSTSRRIRQFYLDAADFGIRSGITVPVSTAFGRMSMLTIASHRQSISLNIDVDPVAAAAAVAQLHATIEQTEIEPTAKPVISMTAKQALMLRWSAEGKTMGAIATMENTSFSNVAYHIGKARKALNAGTLPQATALATKLKLI